MAAAPLLERLTRLDFGSPSLRPELSDRLEFGSNFISPEALTTLLESPQIGISELSLCGTFYPWHQSASDYQVTEAYTLPASGRAGSSCWRGHLPCPACAASS